MMRRRIFSVLLIAIACCLGRGSLGAETAPAVTVQSPASLALETSESTITLHGSAQTEPGLANVLWVNQFGQRGHGTWLENPQRVASWTVPDVGLHPGINLITVTWVDGANRGTSVHFVINRKIGAAARLRDSLGIGSGYYRNRPVVFQRWGGHSVVEGDVILDDISASPSTPKGGAPLDAPAASAGQLTPYGAAINYLSQFWPKVGGVYQVPYVQSGSSANLTSALASFNSTFSGLIQFVSRSSEANYVNIVADPSGSGEGFSNVGMIGGEQTLECGGGCTVATWLHEMGHTVGLLHEHQRSDRAKFIKLTTTNADLPNVPGNFTLFTFDDQLIGLYDYASVMHYGAFDFSKAGQPVIESIPAGIPLGNDAGYSAGDIDEIKRLYNAAPAAVTITTNPVGLQVMVDGVTYTAPQSFSFTLGSTHTLALPADPQFTSPADGSAYIFGKWNDQGASSHSITIARGNGVLATPKKTPAVTVYQASFVRLDPVTYASPQVYPGGSGTLAVTPAPLADFGGSYYVDRTLVKMTLTANAGYSFYDWFNLPYPPSSNPFSFYIQAPISGAQAVLEPTSVPVTIVGATLTSTNKWNPGLAATVDGQFTLLPTGFTPVYNAGWAGGTQHTIDVDQTQSPVTTNVYYDWNSWSDGKAILHTITQPKTGHKTVNASLTPFYASYTVPAPLGDTNASCQGGVSTSPAGVSYPLSIFPFYKDGTSVTTTATPNSVFPAMVFAGWASGLTGTANPQTITITNQFVPTANFNVVSTPIAITSLTPATAVASPTAAPAITIKGTGFTSNDTFAYWNGNFRPITFVSSTQIVMQLAAGDLANAGGQDIYVGNYTTNASNQTCGVAAETSFTVHL